MPLASPIAVSSITFLGNVVTVNTATNHNLAVNQGFSLTTVIPVAYNVNSTVATTPLATSFTFFLQSPPTYVSGGSMLPAKETIMLNAAGPQVGGQAGQIFIRYLLWLTTVTPVFSAGVVSSWFGASAQENAALVTGNTIEMPRSFSFPSSTSKANIQSAIQADFVAQQAALVAAIQPGLYFGVYYDGTGWSA
jgi:hypothetical protein